MNNQLEEISEALRTKNIGDDNMYDLQRKDYNLSLNDRIL